MSKYGEQILEILEKCADKLIENNIVDYFICFLYKIHKKIFLNKDNKIYYTQNNTENIIDESMRGTILTEINNIFDSIIKESESSNAANIYIINKIKYDCLKVKEGENIYNIFRDMIVSSLRLYLFHDHLFYENIKKDNNSIKTITNFIKNSFKFILFHKLFGENDFIILNKKNWLTRLVSEKYLNTINNDNDLNDNDLIVEPITDINDPNLLNIVEPITDINDPNLLNGGKRQKKHTKKTKKTKNPKKTKKTKKTRNPTKKNHLPCN